MTNYAPKPRSKYGPTNTPGRYPDPSKWKSGPDPVAHEKYYAWLRHRAQAKFRKEHYTITWEEWQQLWPDPLWHKRGRGRQDLVLSRVDLDQGWSMCNLEVTSRLEHLRKLKCKQ